MPIGGIRENIRGHCCLIGSIMNKFSIKSRRFKKKKPDTYFVKLIFKELEPFSVDKIWVDGQVYYRNQK
jgi:hypothetical protein